MEDKKLQNEDLSKVSGGVTKILVPDSGGAALYIVLNVGISMFDDADSFADSVIRKGEGVTMNRWPEGFKYKLTSFSKFRQEFEKMRSNNITFCDVRIVVDGDGNIRDARCSKNEI